MYNYSMVSIPVEYPTDWNDYKLIDSGDGMKLERFGNYIIARPDPRALWAKHAPELWNTAHATYSQDHWKQKQPPPHPWLVTYKDMTFTLRPTEFKHVGVFPEQATNWDWIRQKSKQSDSISSIFLPIPADHRLLQPKPEHK